LLEEKARIPVIWPEISEGVEVPVPELDGDVPALLGARLELFAPEEDEVDVDEDCESLEVLDLSSQPPSAANTGSASVRHQYASLSRADLFIGPPI
jgi:hypothetical protein